MSALNNLKLTLSASPHITAPISTTSVMANVIGALVPAAAVGVYVFGIQALWLMLATVAACVAGEAFCCWASGRRQTIGDLSAVVTGLLLAFNLPVSAPLWLGVVGGLFAIIIVKFLFGGIGQNIVNPALAARAALLASWPTYMTAFTLDGVSTATPLGMLHGGGTYAAANMPSLTQLFLGNVAGCLGETSALALLLGGLYLIWRGVISWRVPVIYLATVALLTTLIGRGELLSGKGLYEILAGGMMLGAFFMATDYTTCPIAPKGQIIFALGCGFLTSIIRLYGGYAEGVSYSILIMNLFTPLIDKVTKPKIFGEVKKG